MSNLKKVMQERNIKYFSSLSIQQKQQTKICLRLAKNNLLELNYGLAIEILKNLPFEQVIKENQYIDENLKGAKMFYYEKYKVWMPLKSKELFENWK